jgi:hypothetical protein
VSFEMLIEYGYLFVFAWVLAEQVPADGVRGRRRRRARDPVRLQVRDELEDLGDLT